MKNPERVAELLAELKVLAENDFERHRIAVLERDLTAPPTVEIVDDTHQKFDGVTFVQKADEHFKAPVSIHRAVYSYFNGEIPKDCVIHHVDLNPSNNEISNLRLMSISEHRTLHLLLNPISKKAPPKIKVCPNCGEKFFATPHQRRKYCSKECAKQAMAQSKQKIQNEKICPICGKNFPVTINRKKYCSHSCVVKAISLSRTKLRSEKVCPICGEKFFPRNRKSKYCSMACSGKATSLARSKPPVEKQCPVCGKKFIPNRKKQMTCSRSCGGKLATQKQYSSINLPK